MKFLSILINDDGQHWDKRIRIFGILVYHCHVYTRPKAMERVGFTISEEHPKDL